MRKDPLFSSSLTVSPRRTWRRPLVLGFILALGVLLASCSDMIDQNKYGPLDPSGLWSDGRSARPIPTGVVQDGKPVAGNPLLSGMGPDGQPVTTLPVPVTLDLMMRGQQQFDIYCTPCHGYAGQGDGVAVEFGMLPPPSFHTQAIYNMADGHIFDVITNGYGRMLSYGYRVEPQDRWAVVAYLRALELSQNANPQLLTPQERQRLEANP